MKHIAHTWRLLPVCIGLLAVACEPANLNQQIADGRLVFRVTGIDDTATKAAAEISGDTFTLPGLSGDVLTASGDTLRMRVQETAMTGMLRGAEPATKATPLRGNAFPDTLSFGLLACTYLNSGDNTGWKYSAVARTDRDKTRADDKQSGKWVPVAASRLTWPGSGFVRYFAYAPFTDADNDNIDDLTVTTPQTLKVNTASGGEPSLEYTVPGDVSRQVDLLVATPRSTREYDGDPGYMAIDIPMTFCHALTGIRFRVGAGLTIDSVAVKGVYNSGKLGLAAAPAWTVDPAGTASYTIKDPGLAPDPHDSGFQLAEPEYTMLLLPQKLPEGATITATVSRTENPTVSYTVTADIKGYTWQPGTLVTYTITDSDLLWVFEIIDEVTGKPIADTILYDPATALHPLTIASYSGVNFGGVSTSVTAQPWEVKFSNDGGSTWKTIPGTLWVKFLNGTADSTGGSGTTSDTLPEIRQLDIQGSILDSATVSIPAGVGDADRIALLRNRSTLYTSTSRENPHDLSMHNIYGQLNASYTAGTQDVPGINAAGPHTSNCYIVSEPGWYCFPLVYGNAIDATRGTGNDNNIAYGSSLAASERSKWFFDSYGRGITSPYISDMNGNPVADDLKKYDAVVIWQDVKSGYEVIKDADIEVVPSISGGLPCPYIRFKIEKGDNKVDQQKYPGYLGGGKAGILPCNIVIGLRDTTHRDDTVTKDGSQNGPHILWSWHIWVTPVTGSSETDSDFGISEIKYRKTRNSTTDLGTVQILNTVLGWTPPLYFYGGGSVVERLTLLRFRQTAAGGKSKIVAVHQKGAHTEDDSGGMTYQGTFYQWGRKDPLIAGRAASNENSRNRVFSSEKGYRPVHQTAENKLNSTTSTNAGTEHRYPYLFMGNQYYRHGAEAVSRGFQPDSAGLAAVQCPVWNINGNYSSTSMNATVKTIFDPCPPGFCVPFNNAFSGFYLENQPYGVLKSSERKWTFTADATTDPTSYTIDFQFSGWRANNMEGVFSFDHTVTEGSGEGPWLSSMEVFRVAEKFQRKVVLFRMKGSAVGVSDNMVSRGNVVRPIVEQLPASSTSGSTEGYGSGGTAPF